jgi:Phage lysozyme.
LNDGEPALQTYHGSSDASHVHTIGWGHAMFNTTDGDFTFSDGTTINLYALKTCITPDQAEEILSYDIDTRQKELNAILDSKGIREQVNQQFYDALFLLMYQVGKDQLEGNTDLSTFLDSNNFDPNNEQEIKEQFGEYTNNLEDGTMRRIADELDIILLNDYNRDYDQTRHGDIWRKKTYPDMTTPGY